MSSVGTPLTAVPAHPVISFEAAVVPGHLGGPRLLLTGKQRPDLLAQSGEEGDLDKQERPPRGRGDGSGARQHLLNTSSVCNKGLSNVSSFHIHSKPTKHGSLAPRHR